MRILNIRGPLYFLSQLNPVFLQKEKTQLTCLIRAEFTLRTKLTSFRTKLPIQKRANLRPRPEMTIREKEEAEAETIESQKTDRILKTISTRKKKMSTIIKLSCVHFMKKVNATKAQIVALLMALKNFDVSLTFTKLNFVWPFKEAIVKNQLSNANMHMEKNS